MIQPPTSLTPVLPSAAVPMRASADRLGQQDFLTLLTTQLRNQDPLNPMQNTEFLGQMAQFSTVSGIERLHTSLEGMGAGLREMRMGMASNMIGQSVLVPATVAFPGRDGAYRGQVALDAPATDVNVSYLDVSTGALLHQQELGALRAGNVGFAWQNPPPEFVTGNKAIRVTVDAQVNGEFQILESRVYAKVLAGVIGQGSDDIALDVEGFGLLQSVEIDSIR